MLADDVTKNTLYWAGSFLETLSLTAGGTEIDEEDVLEASIRVSRVLAMLIESASPHMYGEKAAELRSLAENLNNRHALLQDRLRREYELEVASNRVD
jgi:hypothetical protein